VDLISEQNFVPVIDDQKNFIGIITRKAVIKYLSKEIKKK
ncbi:MAG: CBS domain-containing protein, partial [Bacilli bacterium]|nr:CBS domain-containing protein [Bacilli bacterium]